MAQINKPSQHFNIVNYTGNGSTQSITGVGFQPDLVWIKSKSNTYEHKWTNSVRGATKEMHCNDTSAEGTDANGVTSFDSDGFSLGSTAGFNGSSATFISYNFKANGSSTSSNTDGSITSNVSANTSSGFSIITYTGTGSAATIGHGLGSAPKMIIVKPIATTGVWLTWIKGMSIEGQIQLQATDAIYTQSGIYWNSTEPTSSVFSVGTSGSVNSSGVSYIAYVFAESKGFSKFGTYTGNGSSSEGPHIYTGFRPKFFFTKTTSSVNDWYMWDDTRDVNPNPGGNRYLFTNSTIANSSATTKKFDYYSNGFKFFTADGSQNENGVSYVYAAFADNPLVGTNNIVGTAVGSDF